MKIMKGLTGSISRRAAEFAEGNDTRSVWHEEHEGFVLNRPGLPQRRRRAQRETAIMKSMKGLGWIGPFSGRGADGAQGKDQIRSV